MTAQVLTGDCRALLAKLPARSVQSVITSPPYYGLRDYRIPPTIWGGDALCEHDFNDRAAGRKANAKQISIQPGYCVLCGAWRGALGLEPNYQLYIQHMAEVFRAVWRVLRDDGTLWLNLGDCYATGAGAVGSHPGGGAQGARWRGENSKADVRGGVNRGPMTQPNRMPQPGMKAKDMMGIPWRVAFALQDDGWYLRRDVIWHKLNPMPESTYDRPTSAHEYLFLLAKSGRTLLWRHRDLGWTEIKPTAPDYIWRHRHTRQERREPITHKDWVRVNLWRGYDYFYDAEAIMELSSPDSHARAARGRSEDHKYADGGPGDQTIARNAPVAGRMLPIPGGWDTEGEGHHGSVHRDGRSDRRGANSRSTIDRTPGKSRKAGVTPKAAMGYTGPKPKQNESYSEALGTAHLVPMRNKRSVWPIATEPFKGAHFATFPPELIEPCILASSRPGDVVLDPFGGAGTVGMVADRLQRSAILLELSRDYVAMARSRINGDMPLFPAAASSEAAE